MVQNALARTITRSPRSVTTSQLLSNLYWLPIHKRINQGRHFNVQGPFYSTTCLPLHPHILPSTQSFAAFLQSVSPPSPQGKNRFRTSCFSSAAPKIWNHIPAAIKVSPSLDRPLSRRRQPPRRIFRHAPRRRRNFLWLSRIPAEFFKRSSQPNIFRRKFGANTQRSLNETDYIKSSHFS